MLPKPRYARSKNSVSIPSSKVHSCDVCLLDEETGGNDVSEISTDNQKKYCIICGAAMSQDAKWCPDCGMMTAPSEHSNVMTDSMRCGRCGIQRPIGALSCTNCGYSPPGKDDSAKTINELNRIDSAILALVAISVILLIFGIMAVILALSQG